MKWKTLFVGLIGALLRTVAASADVRHMVDSVLPKVVDFLSICCLAAAIDEV